MEATKEDMKSEEKILKKGSEIIKWAEKMSVPIGMWPLSLNPFLFSICAFHYTFYIVLALIDIYKSFDDIEKVINKIAESMAIVFIYIRMLLLRGNINLLTEIFSQVLKDFNVGDFESFDEIKLFMQFVKKGIYLLRGFITLMLATEVLWYVSALIATPEFFIDNKNQTIFIIPYNIYIFFEINSLTRYYLTLLCIMPTVWAFAFGNLSVDCMLISLIFYICGKITVLSTRIDALENSPNCRKKLNKIIFEHSKLLRMKNGVKDAYSSGLLVYLVTINIIICLLGYIILLSFMTTGREEDVIKYILFLLQMYAMLSIYCIISEYMTAESLKCCESFYNCPWYTLPIDCSKDIIYCIERSQQPLALWAGSFTTFSNMTLTDVTKTAVGYLSVLRNFMTIE